MFKGLRGYLIAKRAVDLLVAGPALVVLSVVAPIVLFTMGRPVLFRAERAGRDGRPLTMLKFRSMTNERDAVGKLLPEEERMTGFGKFMRRTSLDELPQMLNVLKGDMTLVGPRPLPTEYTSRYDERQALRLCVKPGLTGWCQVLYHGGDRKWEEKLDQDAFYVEHRSLRLDARILSMTAAALLRRFLRNQSGLSTSRAFLVGAKSDREHTP